MWPHFKLNMEEAVKKVSLCVVVAFCGTPQNAVLFRNLTIT